MHEATAGPRAVLEQLQQVKMAMMTDLLIRGASERHASFKVAEVPDFGHRGRFVPWCPWHLALGGVDAATAAPAHTGSHLPLPPPASRSAAGRRRAPLSLESAVGPVEAPMGELLEQRWLASAPMSVRLTGEVRVQPDPASTATRAGRRSAEPSS